MRRHNRWPLSSAWFWQHNFYVFPRQELTSDHYEFLCQTTSIDFLAKYHFDFNTCINEGCVFAQACTHLGFDFAHHSDLKSTLTVFISAGQVATSSTYEQAIVIQRTGESQCLNTRISYSSGTSHENSRLDRPKIASAKPLQLTHLKGPIL
ncbi:unnamed protein product [Brassica rapa subsp. narinosa]